MSNLYSPTLGSDRYLNDVNSTGIGTQDGVLDYKGMLGRKMALSNTEALNLTNLSATNYSSTTPLKGGVYQLVQMKSANTITPARGLAVYWDPTAADNAFIVTTDKPTAGSQIAGFLLNAASNSKYVWILVEGMGYLKCKSSLAQSGAVGQICTIDTATGTINNLATDPLAISQTSSALTDNSGGTPSTTIPAQTGAYVQATQQNTIASLAAMINKLTVDMTAVLAGLQASFQTGGSHIVAYDAPANGAYKLFYVRAGIAPLHPGLQ